ncbi:MAG TPA: serine/threonine-protein kinase [Thermoanaerobaculia bacterium]
MRDDAPTELRSTPAASRFAEARFTPGAVVANRYRIVSLLGGGGMGEVYRADDLKLGQRVALKYVPTHHPAALERLYAEVRVGRQIAHPNVCRLYDIIDVGGQHFITMEYVDGEDLASLLRRIGRLPADKALALTRDLCAGLAASHDCGFIHRDLKPANVMIDGRGNARITDFGLAGLADDTASVGGTPLYMAPEQLDRGIATPRSDIYALGLVLFEMFTGRRVFDGQTLNDLRAQHALTKTRPSSLVQEIDPAVERVILRCLEEDPALRPATAHEVLLALPGSDPLRAAVAAGETPSPEMVAAAGRTGELPAPRAWALLFLTLALLALMPLLRQRVEVTSRMSEVKGPEALRDRARSVVRSLGYARAPYESGAYVRNTRYADARPRNARLGPAAAPFLYRDSPEELVPSNENGWVMPNDPAVIVPGMSWVLLDAEGKLLELRRIAPARLPSPNHAEWSAAFREAGLDPAQFRETAPVWNAPVPSDTRAAWIRDRDALRVEGAAAAGRPVWFAVLERGATPFPNPPTSREPSGMSILFAVLLFVGVFIARQNVVRDRADRSGAVRVSAFCGLASFIGWIAITRHHLTPNVEWSRLTGIAGSALFFALAAWICYLAIEPYFRRRWPHQLTAWKRVLNGRLRDPLVGTEILAGLAFGAAATVAMYLSSLALGGEPLNSLANPSAQTMFGALHPLLRGAAQAVSYAIGLATLLVVLRLLVRRDLPAFAIAFAVCVLAATPTLAPYKLVDQVALMAAVLLALRFGGLLACTAAFFCFIAAGFSPLTLAPGDWYFARSAFVLIALAALAVFSFHASLAGKPLLGRLEDEAAA